jgi:hypothetical protein
MLSAGGRTRRRMADGRGPSVRSAGDVDAIDRLRDQQPASPPAMARLHPRLALLAALFLALVGLSLAATPTSFCKCTCFGNSTIVALDAPATTAHAHALARALAPRPLDPRAAKRSCNDCNRQFCLGYSFCKAEKDDNVSATCFQRDSTKDQVIVIFFIAATLGLLAYAAVRPWIDQWRERAQHGRPYIPVSTQPDH